VSGDALRAPPNANIPGADADDSGAVRVRLRAGEWRLQIAAEMTVLLNR
jgi:hypothetical protein